MLCWSCGSCVKKPYFIGQGSKHSYAIITINAEKRTKNTLNNAILKKFNDATLFSIKRFEYVVKFLEVLTENFFLLDKEANVSLQ
jgi:arabinogalactan endo-1,4-beta-galactosidase